MRGLGRLASSELLAVAASTARACGRTSMPWTSNDYPSSMRHLAPAVRAKAVEIANALLAEQMDEGMAIRVAIARAKQWAQRRGIALTEEDA